MDKYPLTKNFLSEANLDSDHFLSYIDEGDPNLSAFELFFSLKDLPGFSDKIREIKGQPIRRSFSIEGMLQWASICAELSAIELIYKWYEIQICGFNQHSPRSLKENNDCDFTGIWQNEIMYFEVKNNCKEESQDIPNGLLSELDKIDWGYTLGIEAKIQKMKLSNTEEIIKGLKEHIVEQDEWRKKYVPNDDKFRPANYNTDEFLIRFLPKDKLITSVIYFSPPSLQDICAYLFGIDIPHNTIKPKIPMIENAKQKGADYLVIRLPRFEEFHEVINKSFKFVKKKKESVYLISDELLDGIVGVILFNKKEKHCLILNANTNPKRYITN